MPRTTVSFFCDEEGSVPVLDWLASEVAGRDVRIVEKCRAALAVLAQDGRDLRRPTADYLQDGIYELRVRFGSLNFRMLYFFLGHDAVVVSHGIIKENRVPQSEIDLALSRKTL